MARRRNQQQREQEKKIVGDLSDPQGTPALVRTFLESITVRDFSEGTIRNRRLHLNDFIAWCNDRGLLRPTDITRPILQRYQRSEDALEPRNLGGGIRELEAHQHDQAEAEEQKNQCGHGVLDADDLVVDREYVFAPPRQLVMAVLIAHPLSS